MLGYQVDIMASSSFRPSSSVTGSAGAEAEPEEVDSYEPPVIIDLGSVREATLGSSSSGNADANSQYYW